LEIGNALAGLRYRKAAVQSLDAVENDPKIEIIPITEELYARAFELYWNRPDKEWGLIDCISFIVMDEHGITDALTADDHFRQAGFRVLLKEN
jgi:predicted nucleic acid-binding protein